MPVDPADRGAGSLVAQALGDALGFLVEGQQLRVRAMRRRLDCHRFPIARALARRGSNRHPGPMQFLFDRFPTLVERLPAGARRPVSVRIHGGGGQALCTHPSQCSPTWVFGAFADADDVPADFACVGTYSRPAGETVFAMLADGPRRLYLAIRYMNMHTGMLAETDAIIADALRDGRDHCRRPAELGRRRGEGRRQPVVAARSTRRGPAKQAAAC